MKTSILSKNDKEAQKLREHFKQFGLFVVNLMSSPGSGKTTLLESLAKIDSNFCVIEGDLQTNRDTQRLWAAGIQAIQISTGDACHLEAAMVRESFLKLQSSITPQTQFLFIENVGNLVCPASYDVAAHMNIVALSVCEGDDKVLKYPTMFLCADVVLITKADLMPHFSFEVSRVQDDLRQLKADIPLFLISKNQQETLQTFYQYLISKKEQGYVSSHTF